LSRNSSPRAVELLKDARAWTSAPHHVWYGDVSEFNEAVEELLDPNLMWWERLALNPAPGAIRLIEKDMKANPAKWSRSRPTSNDEACVNLASNPAAIHLLRAMTHRQRSREGLCRNPNPDALLLLGNIEYLKPSHWSDLSANPAAIRLLETNPDKIDWVKLSANPAAILLLEANPDKIDWTTLSANPAALSLLKTNQAKIHWHMLLYHNHGAMELIRDHPRITWQALSHNPGIFALDYAAMYEHMTPIREELLRNRMHPRHVHKLGPDWQLL
jgi:hypothetical protein